MESHLERLSDERAKKLGWIVRKLSWVGRRSAPDKFYARRGKVILIEYKQPGEPLRPDQFLELKELRKFGVIVFIVDNLKSAYAIFETEIGFEELSIIG